MGAIALVVTVFWPILWPVLLAVVGGAVAIGVCDALCERIAPTRRLRAPRATPSRSPSVRGGGLTPERPRPRCGDDIALARQRAEERRMNLRHR